MASRIWLLTALIGCGSDPELPAADRAMLSDSFASIGQDSAAVEQIERTFSPSFAYQFGPDGDVSRVADDAIEAATTAIHTRLGAGCVATTTVLPAVPAPGDPARTAIFDLAGCSFAGQSMSGTITSRWGLIDGALQVDHVSDGLLIDGAPVSVRMTVSGNAGDSTQSRVRELSLTAEPIQITGAWGETYDLTTGCAVRSGRSTTTFGGTAGIDRVDTGLAWCGSQDELPPLTVDAIDGGTIELERLGRRVVARFLGDGQLDVLTSRGERVDAPAD